MTTHTCYTALIGNYEDLKTPTVITPGWRYICYTDQVITNPVWEIKQLNVHLEPQRMARYVKINFHKFVGSEFSLWLDASFRIDCNLQTFWDKHFKGPISAPAHPQRDSVYQEISNCLYCRRGEPDLVKAQGDHYRNIGVEPQIRSLLQKLLRGIRLICSSSTIAITGISSISSIINSGTK
jgi:hypothetical protein